MSTKMTRMGMSWVWNAREDNFLSRISKFRIYYRFIFQKKKILENRFLFALKNIHKNFSNYTLLFHLTASSGIMRTFHPIYVFVAYNTSDCVNSVQRLETQSHLISIFIFIFSITCRDTQQQIVFIPDLINSFNTLKWRA